MSAIGILGLSAPVLFLYAYAMLSFGRWGVHSLKYHLLNFLGAVFILISLIEQWNLAVCILEACWGAISVAGMVKAVRARK
jgi:E3 ubiquitin-protein ligase DOA10